MMIQDVHHLTLNLDCMKMRLKEWIIGVYLYATKQQTQHHIQCAASAIEQVSSSVSDKERKGLK